MDYYKSVDGVKAKLDGATRAALDTHSYDGKASCGLSFDDASIITHALGEYKKMAVYFADILAASASDVLGRKSTGKYERARHERICQTVREMLENEYGGPARTSERMDVCKRLNEVLASNAKKA